MFEAVNTIVLSGVTYPIKCDILVLEKIQQKYEDIREFEKKLVPYLGSREKKETDAEGNYPSAETLLDALTWMINEGEAILADTQNKEANVHSREELARKNDLSVFKLANTLYIEFTNCFMAKNVTTTQNPQIRKEKFE